MWKTVSPSAQGVLNPEVDGYAGWPTHQPHQSSSPQQRERARKSTLAGQRTFVATRDLAVLFLCDGAHRPGWPAWTVSENSQRRVAIVVVGVTPHQGDGSTVRRAKGHRQRRSHVEVYRGARPHGRRFPRMNISLAGTVRCWRAGCSDELPAQF